VMGTTKTHGTAELPLPLAGEGGEGVAVVRH
jgi:hypothetical protein